MKKTFIISVVFYGFLILSLNVPAYAGKTYWGTPAKGMAGAYTATPGGFAGISYNPASSASVTNFEFASSFSRFSQNSLNVNNGSLGLGFGTGAVTQGLAINRTALDFDFNNFSVTTSDLGLNYDDNVLYYNASIQPIAAVRLGANAKYFRVQSDVEEASATGFGLDLGYQQMVNQHVILGVSAIDLSASRDWETGLKEDIPYKIRAGVNLRPIQSLSFAVDGIHDEITGFEAMNFGGEWWIVRRIPTANNQLVGLALRSGLTVQQVGAEELNFSMGFSFKMGFGEVHYAFQERSNFENQQQFGLTVKFGGASY